MKRALTPCLLALLVCSAGFAQYSTFSASGKISKDLQTIDTSADVDVIVQFKSKPTGEHFRRIHALGGIDKRVFEKVPGAAFTMHASALQTLANDPDVAYVSVDRHVHSHLDLSAATINAPMAWSQSYTGAGIGVAVIDSGIAANLRDLGNASGQTGPGQSRVVYAENLLVPPTNPDGHANPAFYQTHDGYGHGSHVAGIIAGNGFQSSGPDFISTYKGIAPQANLIDLQVLDATGSGSDSDVIAAIEEAIRLKNTYNIRVINLSLGRPVYESFAVDPLCQAVEQAWQAGIVVVVAAGNDGRDDSFGNNGYGTIEAPANDPYVITVGAMNAKLTGFRGDDVITTYSSKGPTPVDHIVKPDIMAPGNHVSSLLSDSYLAQNYPSAIVNPLAYQLQNGASNYLILSGTSMAAGVVSGAVADLLNARPNLTPDQVKAILMLTAGKQFSTYSDSYYSFAALTYQTHLKLVQNQQALQRAQQAIQPVTDQVKSAQNQLTTANAQTAAATLAYRAAFQALNQATAALTIAQSQAVSLSQAYALAQQRLTTANLAVQQAQATVQTSQQVLNNAQSALDAAPHQPAAGPGSVSGAIQAARAAFQTAQSSLAQAQINLTAAISAQQSAQQSQQQAQHASDQAANNAQQAQTQVNQAQNQVQQTHNQLNQATANASSAAAALQQATQALVADQQAVASYQALVTVLASPAATNAAQLAAMQSDPTQYTSAPYDAFTVGAGYLDLNAALTSTALPPRGPALSPVAYIDPVTGLVYATDAYGAACGNPSLGGSNASPLIGSAFCTPASLGNAIGLWDFTNGQIPGESSAWGNQAVWGSRSVWGTSLVDGQRAVWGTSSLLAGQSAVSGQRSCWGLSETQAYSTIWSSRSVWGASAQGAASTDNATAILTSGDQ